MNRKTFKTERSDLATVSRPNVSRAAAGQTPPDEGRAAAQESSGGCFERERRTAGLRPTFGLQAEAPGYEEEKDDAAAVRDGVAWGAPHNSNSSEDGEAASPVSVRSASSDSGSPGADGSPSGKTRFLRELGRGASGVVYETLSPGNSTTKAVKMIPFGDRGLPCPLEVAIMSSIRHPHLTSAELAAVYGDKLFIVTRQADCDLASHVRLAKNGHPVFGEQLRKWTWQLTSALLCLHAENIIHTDVKTANVLLYGDDLKLGDFTIATRAKTSNGRLIRHFLRLGTARYRAPEVRRKCREGWSTPADLWSLGCTLYEVAYGRPFFPTRTRIRKARDDRKEEKEREERDKEHMEKELDDLIDQWRHKRAQGKVAAYFPQGEQTRDFNDLLIRLLDCDQFTRATAESCMAHPYLAGMGRPNYEVSRVVCETSAKRTSRGPLDCETSAKRTAESHSWIERLLSYVRELNLDESLKAEACQSLVDKMNHKHPDYEDMDEEERGELIAAEVRVCEYLDWHLL